MNSYRKHSKFFGLLVSASITLTGCQTLDNVHLGPKLGIKIPIEEKYSEEQQASLVGNAEDNLMFSQLNNGEDLSTDIQAAPKKVFIGSGQFIKKGSKSTNVQLVGEGKYSVNLDAADIGEVCKIILSDMLHENYVLSPKVRGSITLQTTRPLHKEELLSTLEMLLRVNGAVLIKQKGMYRIEPDVMAVQAADTSQLSSNKLGVGYQMKVMPLRYIGAEDMAEIIKPVLPAQAVIKVDPARNLLFVAGTRDELVKALNLVQTFDVNFIAGMSFGLYPLENTEVDSIVDEIENIFNQGGKNPLAGVLRFISIKHLNSVLVVTPQKAYLREAEKWINRLDQQNGVVGEGGIMVYRVQHVDAVELAETLNSIISGISASKRNAPSIAPGRRVATITNKAKKVTVNTKRGDVLSSTSLEGVSIVADEPNNALVIMAEPQQYRTLHKVIKRLDVMPLQVLLDSTIVAVDLTDNLKYGVKWKFNNSGPNGMEGIGVLGTVAKGLTAAASGGFSYGLQRNSDDIRLVFNALADDNKINVLSSPSLMVLNNHEASIKVGDQIPIRTSETTNTDGSGNLQTSPIQMVDTGVLLTIKPRVNATGVVILEVEQSVNTPLDTNASSGIDSPAILKREFKSSVAILSGESVVLGGLISERHTFTNTGFPFLKDIPYVGWLFGTQGKKVERTELIVVITPRVVSNKFDARKVTDEFKRKLTGIYYDQDKFTPGADVTHRGYDGMIIQTDKERVKPLQKEQ
jgi:general secretion pathway protein D